jgi:hypothetical protein
MQAVAGRLMVHPLASGNQAMAQNRADYFLFP